MIDYLFTIFYFPNFKQEKIQLIFLSRVIEIICNKHYLVKSLKWQINIIFKYKNVAVSQCFFVVVLFLIFLNPNLVFTILESYLILKFFYGFFFFVKKFVWRFAVH